MRAALAASLLVVAGCGGLDQVDFTRTGSTIVPGDRSGAPLPAAIADGLGVALGPEALRDAGVDPGSVDSARVRRLTLRATGGSSLETWLDAVSFYVEGGGRPRATLAQASGIRARPPGTTSVELDVTGVDLEPYLTATDGRIGVEASGILPEADTTVEAEVTVRVDVNVTGLFH